MLISCISPHVHFSVNGSNSRSSHRSLHFLGQWRLRNLWLTVCGSILRRGRQPQNHKVQNMGLSPDPERPLTNTSKDCDSYTYLLHWASLCRWRFGDKQCWWRLGVGWSWAFQHPVGGYTINYSVQIKNKSCVCEFCLCKTSVSSNCWHKYYHSISLIS